jgi:5'-methylthioadenosine phosphorylase
MIGLIGGYNLENILAKKTWKAVKTKHGKPSSEIVIGEISNKKVALILRHGEKHSIPPHKINHKANIRAFYDLGVKYIIATAACGIINSKFKLGDFILPDDFIDFTFQPTTFFGNFENEPRHVFMGKPYSKRLRQKILFVAKNNQIKIYNGGVYANMPGPRLETQAELKMLKKLGADMVGMTNAPEIILANELGIEITTIAIGVNYTINAAESDINIKKIIDLKKNQLKNLLQKTIEAL